MVFILFANTKEIALARVQTTNYIPILTNLARLKSSLPLSTYSVEHCIPQFFKSAKIYLKISDIQALSTSKIAFKQVCNFINTFP